MAAVLERAEKARASGDFETAASLYTKVITIHARVPHLDHFDQRAACYEKLNRLHDAFEDARSMMRLDRSNARGYLRAGKALQLLDQDERALRYYKKGILSTSSKDVKLNILMSLSARLEQRLYPANLKGLDPMRLPTEVCWEVLFYLTFEQKMTSRRVSRRWNRMVEDDPATYRSLDLTCSRSKYISIVHLDNYLRKSRGNLRLLKTAVRIDQHKVLKYHIQHSPRLTCLALRYSDVLHLVPHLEGNLQHLQLYPTDSGVTFRECMWLLARMKNLKSLQSRLIYRDEYAGPEPVFEHTALQVLNLGVNSHIPPTGLARILSSFPSLTELILPGVADSFSRQLVEIFPKKLTRLWLGEIMTMNPLLGTRELVLPATLTELCISCKFCSIRTNLPPTLKALKLVRCCLNNQWWQETVLPICSSLGVLELIEYDMPFDVLEMALLSTCNLQRIALVPAYDTSDVLTDTLLQTLFEKNPGLQYLNISKCLKISGSALALMVKRHPSLKHIAIAQCAQLPLEVVTWLRAQNVQVSVKDAPANS